MVIFSNYLDSLSKHKQLALFAVFTRFIYPYDSLFKDQKNPRGFLNIRKRSREISSFTKLDEEYSPAPEGQSHVLLRKEVIQPQVLLRLPCYDFTPVTSPTFDSCPLADSSPASGVTGSHGVTGGVYKARERIQRGMLIHVY